MPSKVQNFVEFWKANRAKVGCPANKVGEVDNAVAEIEKLCGAEASSLSKYNIDDLLKRIETAEQQSVFKADFATFTDEVKLKFFENPELVESWKSFKNAGLDDLARNTTQLEKFNALAKSNNLGLDAKGLEDLLSARTATKNLPWEHPDEVLDAVKRASDANIDGVSIKGFPTPEDGSTSFILNNAKQYQLEASGDALLSFEKNGVSFDNVTSDGTLIDRKYGHGASVFNADGTVKNQSRAQSILKQGRAQIDAADGMPVKWEVSTELGADGIQNLFDNASIDIEVVYVPQKTIIN